MMLVTITSGVIPHISVASNTLSLTYVSTRRTSIKQANKVLHRASIQLSVDPSEGRFVSADVLYRCLMF
jgi:hypothetical protein